MNIKKLGGILTISALGLSLVACGKKNVDNPDTPTTEIYEITTEALNTIDPNLASYIGTWEFQNEPQYYISIYDDSTYTSYGQDVTTGNCSYINGALELYNADGSLFIRLYVNEYGQLFDQYGSILVPSSQASDAPETDPAEQPSDYEMSYVGTWLAEKDQGITIYEDHSFLVFGNTGDFIGVWYTINDGISLDYENGSNYCTLVFDEMMNLKNEHGVVFYNSNDPNLTFGEDVTEETTDRLIDANAIETANIAGKYYGLNYGECSISIYSSPSDNDAVGTIDIYDTAGNMVFSEELYVEGTNMYFFSVSTAVDISVYTDNGTICLDLYQGGVHTDYFIMTEAYYS